MSDTKPEDILARNKAWSDKDPSGYMTELPPNMEQSFQNWVNIGRVPFVDSPTPDYDMRGFYKALVEGRPEALTGQNPNDGQLHFTDYFKTPYHESFSNESKWALPNAPSWINDHQLALPDGTVIFDEKAQK